MINEDSFGTSTRALVAFVRLGSPVKKITCSGLKLILEVEIFMVWRSWLLLQNVLLALIVLLDV